MFNHLILRLNIRLSSKIIQPTCQYQRSQTTNLITPFLLPADSVCSPKNSTARQLLFTFNIGSCSFNPPDTKITFSPPTANKSFVYRLIVVQNKACLFLGFITAWTSRPNVLSSPRLNLPIWMVPEVVSLPNEQQTRVLPSSQ